MIDKELLEEQYRFLIEYSWKEGYVPEQVEGICNLIDYLILEGEGKDNG
jgi:hypothetical protein